MKVDLTAKNEKTLYVVFYTKRFKVLLETESLEEARSFVNYNANTDYSKYEPYTYAKNKEDIAEDYSTTFLEY